MLSIRYLRRLAGNIPTKVEKRKKNQQLPIKRLRGCHCRLPLYVWIGLKDERIATYQRPRADWVYHLMYYIPSRFDVGICVFWKAMLMQYDKMRWTLHFSPRAHIHSLSGAVAGLASKTTTLCHFVFALANDTLAYNQTQASSSSAYGRSE